MMLNMCTEAVSYLSLHHVMTAKGGGGCLLLIIVGKHESTYVMISKGLT